MRSDGFAHFKIRFRNFELDFEPAPNGWIKQLRVICDADCETHVAPDVEILQKRIHYEIDFANFLRVISNFGARVKFVEAQNRSEEHTSELHSLMPISYAVLCFKKIK